jgi:hypothetical protein
MPSFAPFNRRVVCPKCSAVFARGHGYNNHYRSCDGEEPPQTVAEETAEYDEDNSMDMTSSDGSSKEEDVVQTHSIEEHFARMEELGTLDLVHVLQYHKWKKVEVQDNEVEICRFLRSNEVGGGASDGKSQASLLYCKSLGGRGDLLPKTMKTCWATVDRVILKWYNVHHNVRFVFIMMFILL